MTLSCFEFDRQIVRLLTGAELTPPSRRMLLDYSSPYLYGGSYHGPANEDLVTLWFGSNGAGKFFTYVQRMIVTFAITLKTNWQWL